MKKSVFILILSLFAVFNLGAQENQSECERLMLQIEERYNVNHLNLPDSYMTSFDQDSIIYFGKTGWFSKEQVQERIDFKQKNKNYRLSLETVSTNVFYRYEASFKVIDYDNQVVQVLKTESDIPGLYMYDCDFDGYEDLLFPYIDDDGNQLFQIYFWSQMQRKFVKDNMLLNNPKFDAKHKKIVEKETYVKGNFRTEIYTIYEFRFGIKRFCCSYKINFVTNAQKQAEDVSFIFWDSEEAKKAKIGEYIYELPSYAAFSSFSESEKKDVRKQYNKMISMFNVL